ncbi:phosphoribosylglycinamide formyltransferase [Pseudoclavibacter endophyticus]|uniref:Phosphoribosylglycinamide formyltransferase n=1 Tax=Pseudoclavibacter endophyticus TaxID=1778590 RepID=A0A6H9WMS6_9MICO|nr:phosphoribosylglycinamide formyltransferase [Pseudoclavibacter endophyticus]KAB1649348.1 phosphoribosylglycinamide formyltransferase [Pseudoclavibacter endophyticus]GGA63298.1 phosphoribosylglycinamide formyltransferase [Pseudoclavibacter endophyticus]
MRKLVVLISGTGSNLRALLRAIDDAAGTPDDLGARVVAIGADTEAANLALGDEFGIPTFVVPPAEYPDRTTWGDALLARIREYGPDLTVLSGFMRLVPPSVVRGLAPALLNTHPSYLPEFPGANAVRDALTAGATRTGATIMIVDDGVDTGPVIDQVRIAIEPGDTVSALHERIKTAERRLLIETVRGIAHGRVDLVSLTAAAHSDAMASRPEDHQTAHAKKESPPS